MDHAHGRTPLPSSRERQDQSFHRKKRVNTPHTPSPSHPQPSRPTLSLPQRRLQLRNAGFRAPQLSAHKIGARISRIFNGNEDSRSATLSIRNEENRVPDNRSIRSIHSDHRSSPSLGILHEITSSCQSHRTARNSNIPVFEDNPEQPLLTNSPTSPQSFYDEGSSGHPSPIQFSPTQSKIYNMRLREVSGNELRSPAELSSPMASSTKVRRKRSLPARKNDFEYAEYIEHIEKELERVKEMMHSPRSGKPLSERLKAIKSENKQLKKTIEDLGESFEGRVKDAVEHMAATEADLRRTIKKLEDEVEQKDVALRDFEHQHSETRLDQCIVDTLKTTIAKLELDKQSLEDANRSIGKRNEVLTELLAMSPIKSQHGFDLVSPVRDGSRRTPRPRSMMIPRLPSSPSVRYSSRPNSVAASPNFLAGYFSPQSVLAEEDRQSCSDEEEINPGNFADDRRSLDSGLGESCSMKSPTVGRSRRSTMVSQGSVSPSSWGLPLPSSPSDDKATIRQIPRRKPRRFMSGSTQLKPLLLPAMTGDCGSIQNPSLLPSLLSPNRREVSEQSIDPTISFLSQPYDTPFSGIEQSPTWLTEEPQSMDDVNIAHLLPLDFGTPELARILGGSNSSPAVEDTVSAFSSHSPVPQSPSGKDDIIFEEDVTVVLDLSYPEKSTGSTLRANGEGTVALLALEMLKIDGSGESAQSRDLELPAIDFPGCSNTSSIDRLLRPEVASCSKDLASALTTSTDSRQLMERCGYDDLEAGPIMSFQPLPNPYLRRKPCSLLETILDSPTPGPRPQPAAPNSPIVSRMTISPNSVIAPHSGTDPRTASASVTNPQLLQSTISSRPRSPLEMLQRRKSSTNPLASVTIQTIYGTLSRYTMYIREIKRDPTGLARRVIANAWRSNWKRFGKLSWWVLGLFLGHGPRREHLQQIAGAEWDWEDYDGEEIAERAFAGNPRQDFDTKIPPPDERLRGNPPSKQVRFDERIDEYRTSGTRSSARPALKIPQDKKTGWGNSLYLWGKFSVAILLAVGGAVVRGPGEMLKDCDGGEIPRTRPKLQAVGAPRDSHESDREIRAYANREAHLNTWMDFDGDPHDLEGKNHQPHSDPELQCDRHSRPPEDECISAEHLAPEFSAQERSSNVPTESSNRSYTFSSPSPDDRWNIFDENGGMRSSRARIRPRLFKLGKTAEHKGDDKRHETNIYDPRSPGVGNGARRGEDSGSFGWMQSLGIEDFLDLNLENGDDDGSKTLRARTKEVVETRGAIAIGA